MVTLKLPTNNDRIAANLKAAFEESDSRLISALAASPGKAVACRPCETSNLGAVSFGLFRERLRTSLHRPSKGDTKGG